MNVEFPRKEPLRDVIIKKEEYLLSSFCGSLVDIGYPVLFTVLIQLQPYPPVVAGQLRASEKTASFRLLALTVACQRLYPPALFTTGPSDEKRAGHPVGDTAL
jgi:hypothetical protein